MGYIDLSTDFSLTGFSEDNKHIYMIAVSQAEFVHCI